jgi:hypothetical protein
LDCAGIGQLDSGRPIGVVVFVVEQAPSSV